MRNIQTVQILYGVKYLIKYSTCCSLLQSHLSRHHPEQFSLLCELCNYVDEICRLDYFVQIDDVGVSYFFHNLHLSLDTDLIVFVLDRTFIDYFYCHFLTSGQMNSFFNLSKSPFA